MSFNTITMEVSIYMAKERKEEGIKMDQIKSEAQGLKFTEDTINMLNWGRIWQEIYDFKIVKG